MEAVRSLQFVALTDHLVLGTNATFAAATLQGKWFFFLIYKHVNDFFLW